MYIYKKNLWGGDEEVPGQQSFQTENKDDDGNNLTTECKKNISKYFTQSLFIYKCNKMPNSPIRRWTLFLFIPHFAASVAPLQTGKS